MIPIIKIDGFEFGILNDKTVQASNGFHFSVGTDIHADEGILQVSRTMIKDMESTITTMTGNYSYWIERYTKNTNCPYYTLLANGEIWGRITNVTGTDERWIRLHSNALTTNRGGLKGFGDTLFYCSDTYLGRTVPVTLTQTATVSTTELHVSNSDSILTTPGDVLVEKEVITYTDTDGDILTGCTRAARGTYAIAHASGVTAIGFQDTFQVLKAQDNLWHPMEVYLGKLNVGDGRYVATLESDQTWTNNKLTMPEGYRASTMKVFGDNLTIGTYKGINFYDYPEAQLFTWNGVDTLPSETWNLKESAITAMEPWKNSLVVFSGVKGNIYQFDGARISKLKNIPKIDNDGLAWVNPGATSIVAGDLLFGLSGSRGDCEPGIYSLGQKTVGKPIALTLKHVGASGVLFNNNDFYPTSLFAYERYGQFFAGIYDPTPDDDYQINYLSSNIKISEGAYWESQVYDVSKNGYPRLLKGVELEADTMASSTGASIFFKVDDASEYSELGEITSTNQGNILKGINQRAKTIQVKLGFTCDTVRSPKIHTIKIY